MEYRDVWMRRVMMRNQKVHSLFSELASGSDDYGRSALRAIFNQLIPEDVEVTTLYNEAAVEDGGTHEISETSTTKMIDILVKLVTWKEFVTGLELYAKNKAANLRRIGLEPEAEKWDRTSVIIDKLPKNPLS